MLTVDSNGHYLLQDGTPFFWLGDTAWLIFANITEEEAYVYLKNRADKGYNVIQAVLIYSAGNMETVNRMYCANRNINNCEYWEHVDRIIKMADSLGLYMALLPSWGSLVKTGVINDGNISEYVEFLAGRYKEYDNIIWVLGGDIKAEAYINLYRKMGTYFKKIMPDKLITFHPFGRCSSTMWFADDDWIDFHMFQSGHRRYDQCTLGTWDDTDSPAYYGEDNWRYVENAHNACDKPVLDGEPSYEWIVQGLHDMSQPYWTAKDIRRYAYWSVFAGACGHTYGDNAVMQFYTYGHEGVNYGAVCEWYEAIHHEGSGQMTHLKKLMESVDFTSGVPDDGLILEGQRKQHDRIAVFTGNDYLFAYDYSGNEFTLNTSQYNGAQMWWMSPVTGVQSYIGKCSGKFTAKKFERVEDSNTDRVLVIRR